MVTINDSIEQRVRKAVRILAAKQSVSAVYVFGSQINGRPDKWSDIDVAVFIENADKLGLPQRARLSALVQKEAGEDVELHFFRRDMIDHPPPASFAKFVTTKGIRLQ